ncbi:MAG: SEL1-like repeat protein [Magnetococcales bacterium]|nr:SEL1-like repeat protein [Magnetococcales bacterium]
MVPFRAVGNLSWIFLTEPLETMHPSSSFTAWPRVSCLAQGQRVVCRLLRLMLLCLLLCTTASPALAEESPAQPAVERLLQAARQGDAVAQTTLGSFYLHGVGVKRNLHKALHWFTQAAEQGDALAQFNLGLLYQEGQGIERDEQKAIVWLQKVAEQSPRADRFHPIIKGWAQLKLGFLHFEGRTQAKNYPEAKRWFERAAAENIGMAQEMLGQIHGQGLGVARNPQLAGQWYQRAAKQGSVSAEKALQALAQAPQSSQSAPAEATSSATAATTGKPLKPTPGTSHKEKTGKTTASQHALTILPTPADAQIRILNIRAPYHPGIRLGPGSYRVEVSKSGFLSQTREIQLADKDRQVAIRLQEQPLEARPRLTVLPTLQGVMVRILNIDTDYRPGIPLPPGTYLLEISKPGFQTVQRWVELSEKDVKLEVSLTETAP